MKSKVTTAQMRVEQDEILSHFKNGEERYRKSALVNICVNSLLHGADPIDLISQLKNVKFRCSDEYKKYLPTQEQISEKLENLKTFYQKVMSRMDWNIYKSINLKYELIIC
jgi:hypothetical protein